LDESVPAVILWLGHLDRPGGEIGITEAVGLPLRFFEHGHKFVTGKRPLNL
jgi:3-methyladenine DNA glycosylase Mpg